MLHFRKLTLCNFGPYKGSQTIDFTDKAGVTIFWGNNGRGKTTLLNAFRYALFGCIYRRSGVLKNLRDMENKEAAAEGSFGFKVILDMNNDVDQYKLTRGYILQSPEKFSKEHVPSIEDYIHVVFLEKNGKVLSPKGREHELNIIMPETVSRFFLFDAELLQEYEELLEENNTEGEHIKEAIENILGVPVLKNGVVDIQNCLERYETEKRRAASNDDAAKRTIQAIEELETNIKQHQSIIADKQAELKDWHEKRENLAQQMKATEKLRNWINDKDAKEREKKAAEDKMARAELKIKALMNSAWKGMLLTTVRDLSEKIQTKVNTLNDKSIKKTVAKSFINEMKKAVNERVCPVCGQDVTGEIIDRLQKKISEQTDEFSGLTPEEQSKLYSLRDALSKVKHLQEDVVDVKDQVRIYEETIDENAINISNYKQEIEELKDNIKRYGSEQTAIDAIEITKKYSEAEQNINDIRKGIEAENAKMEELKINKEKLDKKLDRIAGSTDYRLANKKYELCQHLYNIFAESKDKYRENLKKNVEKDATELFVKLRGDADYVGLKINDNYGLEIIHKSGITVPGRSSGYEHIVALSLIGALHKNAPLRGPIIIDSPFGRLDPTHKANIVRALPTMAEQSMLLAYTEEIDVQVVRKELANHLLAEHTLKRISSMHTEIV